MTTAELVTGLHRADESGPRITMPDISALKSWLPILLAAAAFAIGFGSIRHAAVTEYGLLASASPWYGSSIGLTAFAFAIAIRRNHIRVAVTSVALMILVQRLPSTLSTDKPMYSWTYKHLGVVDYIQHEQTLARGVDIYNGWPGLFAMTAWFSDLTGIEPVSIAHWFTVGFHFLFAGLAYSAARAWNVDKRGAIVVSFLVVTLNWVGQDYYSPQATAMLLTAAILVLVGLSRQSPRGTALIILVFGALTITHQLTPYWLFFAMTLMAVTKRLKPWWIIVPLAVILFSYLAYNFDEVNNFTLFSTDVANNAKGNIPTVGSVGQQMTSLAVRVLSGSMWALTGLCIIRRWRRKEPFFIFGVLALSPLLILAGQGYGGEAIFRVFLYSLLGCSILLAPPLVKMLTKRLFTFFVAVFLLVAGSALSAQGYLGAWFANTMPKEQVEASETVLEQADFPAYLTVVAPVWPQRSSWRYVEYARFSDHFDDPMIFAAKLIGSHFDTDADYAKFTEAINSRQNAPTYLIFTEQMRLYAWYFGILPLDAMPNLKQRMLRDPSWQTVYDAQGLSVFRRTVESPVEIK